MNTIDELIEVLQGIKAGRKWGYLNATGAPQKYHIQSMEALKNTLSVYQLCLMPETITCNGVEIPAPMRVAPKNDRICWAASPVAKGYCAHFMWINDSCDAERLERGIIHATKEAAIAHGRAMCGVRE